MSPSTQVVQTVGTDAQMVFWVLGVAGTVGMCVAGGLAWLNKQLSSTRAQLYSKINRDKTLNDEKAKETAGLAQESKEKVALLEQSRRHQESRLDGLDDKIDNVQREITDTRKEVAAMSLKISENHLTTIGEVRAIGDKFALEIAKMSKS